MKYTGSMLIQVSIGCIGTAVAVTFGNIWQVIVVPNSLVAHYHTNVIDLVHPLQYAAMSVKQVLLWNIALYESIKYD